MLSYWSEDHCLDRSFWFIFWIRQSNWLKYFYLFLHSLKLEVITKSFQGTDLILELDVIRNVMNGTWETLFYSRTKLKLKQRTTMKNFKTCNLKQPFVPLAYNNYTYIKETIRWNLPRLNIGSCEKALVQILSPGRCDK